MGFSPLADMRRRIPDVGRSQPRGSNVVGVLVHHNAGVDAYGQATAPGREVSAQYWITNAGVIIPNIDELRRAFTSGAVGYPGGALADHRFVTVEVSNDGGPGWSISAAAEDALARLIGDVHKRYGLGPVRRGADRGVAVHRDFVATECPGPYVMANLGRIITAAERHRTGTTPKRKKDRMYIVSYKDGAGRGKRGWIIFGGMQKPEILQTRAAVASIAAQNGIAFSDIYDEPNAQGWAKWRRMAGVK